MYEIWLDKMNQIGFEHNIGTEKEPKFVKSAFFLLKEDKESTII